MKFCPLGGLRFITVLRDVPERSCSFPLSGGTHILCRIICKPGKNLLLLCQLMVGNFPLRHRYRLGKKWSYNRSGDHVHVGHCSPKLVVPSGPFTW